MRHVLKNQSECIHFWANQKQSEGKADSIFFDDTGIYSYGRHFRIAKHYPPNSVAITTRHYSVTTSGHVSSVRSSIPHDKTIYYIAYPGDSVYSQIDHYNTEIKAAIKKAATAKTKKEYYLSQARALYEQLRDYAQLINDTTDISALDSLTSNIDLSAYQAEIKAEKAAILEKQRLYAAKNAEKLEAWKNGSENYHFGNSLPAVYLRIKNNSVETTRVPVFPSPLPALYTLLLSIISLFMVILSPVILFYHTLTIF